jgi:hypothetical protein
MAAGGLNTREIGGKNITEQMILFAFDMLNGV